MAGLSIKLTAVAIDARGTKVTKAKKDNRQLGMFIQEEPSILKFCCLDC